MSDASREQAQKVMERVVGTSPVKAVYERAGDIAAACARALEARGLLVSDINE